MSRRKKYTKDIHHEYISTKQYTQSVIFRLSNYFVLLSMIVIDAALEKNGIAFRIPETAYLVVFSAIVGYDIVGIVDKLKAVFSKRSKRV